MLYARCLAYLVGFSAVVSNGVVWFSNLASSWWLPAVRSRACGFVAMETRGLWTANQTGGPEAYFSTQSTGVTYTLHVTGVLFKTQLHKVTSEPVRLRE